MKNTLRYILPVLVVLGLAVAIFSFKGVINSEIPVDYNPDPYPLHQEDCAPQGEGELKEKPQTPS